MPEEFGWSAPGLRRGEGGGTGLLVAAIASVGVYFVQSLGVATEGRCKKGKGAPTGTQIRGIVGRGTRRFSVACAVCILFTPEQTRKGLTSTQTSFLEQPSPLESRGRPRCSLEECLGNEALRVRAAGRGRRRGRTRREHREALCRCPSCLSRLWGRGRRSLGLKIACSMGALREGGKICPIAIGVIPASPS